MELREAGESRREIEALRERLSKLSEASLRISESLDVTTVLRKVLESARALTGARRGAITTVVGLEQGQGFLASGFTSEEFQTYLETPHGREMCERLARVSQPLRLSNLSAHLRSLGLPEEPGLTGTYLGAPIRHQGARVGHFYLGDKANGQEFTDEDEEVLSMFAAQAGVAIANARKHRDEQLARAQLEALIDTSPVGVAVFDARTGQVVSLNRESRRIIGRLHMPGHSVEQLVGAVSVRHGDGREIIPGKYSLAEALQEVTTVRAQEIVVEVPDGRSVSILINAKLIRAEDGEVETVVVTLQDLAPLEELERLRAEFLALVSHELRTPLTSIKGCAASVLGASAPLDPTETLQFFRIIDAQADHMRDLISDLLDVARIETGTLPVAPAPEEVAVMVDQARNTFLSGGGGNPVRIDLPPALPRVLADRRRIVQVLSNLLSNAARHSPQASTIRVAARLDGVHVGVSVTDEGQGIPAERLPHLFRKFAASGREDRARGDGAGLGLAICKGLVEAHGGRIWAESEGADLGTRFTFTIPVVEEAATDAATNRALPPERPRRGAGRTRVLVVDDDPQALVYVRRILEAAGYDPLVTGSAEEVPGLLQKSRPHLVLLDLLLPGTDGIELMERIPALADRPVIFLSGYGRDETIARALQTGAADYVVKPFSPTELVARIQAALRRQADPPDPYQIGELLIDYEARQVTVAGRTAPLTATEYELLSVLSANAGRLSTYDHLLRRVWGSRNSGDMRLVRAFIKKLRRKLGDDAKNPTYIFTERGLGYRMAKPGVG